jgi:peptide chain release factor 1
MIDKLIKIEESYDFLNELLSDPKIISSNSDFKKLKIIHGQISPLVENIRMYKKILDEIQSVKELKNNPEFRKEADNELEILNSKFYELENRIRIQMVPISPEDSKNIVLEIRAGTGGEEAALFAKDVYGMYTKFSEKNGWRMENLSSHYTDIGGFKEIITAISGKNVYRIMKFESGVHRVQRIPITETSGRIHTSAITVAVLPEAEDVEVQIDPQDIRVDVFRSSGPGGQSVNTTDSAVRITHIPTGLVVSCQDEKSQHKNKAKALRVLRARLYDLYLTEQQLKESSDRKKQVGTGDRSERIRTYNFPQGRVTDHRVGVTLYKLDYFMQGEMDEIHEALLKNYTEKAMENADILKSLLEIIEPYRKTHQVCKTEA